MNQLIRHLSSIYIGLHCLWFIVSISHLNPLSHLRVTRDAVSC